MSFDKIFDLTAGVYFHFYNKRIHFPQQLLDFVPLRNGFYSFRAQTDNITLLTPMM